MNSKDQLEFSAPGKMVIAGEYAVLHGGDAVVSAVSARASARIGGEGPLILERAMRVGKRGLFPKRDRSALANAVLEVFSEEERIQLKGALDLDTEDFSIIDRGRRLKFGLGSSAALTVALTALVQARVSGVMEFDFDALFERSRKAHDRFSPKGSGVDVAAAVFGGSFLYSRTNPRREIDGLCPKALCPVAVFSGVSQSTSHFLKRVVAFESKDKKGHDEIMSRISEAARHMVLSQDAADFHEHVQEHVDAEVALARGAEIDIVSAPHRRIIEIAKAHGGTAKPSGAGGGDVAVAFLEHERVEAFDRAIAATGMAVVPVRFSTRGVRIEERS